MAIDPRILEQALMMEQQGVRSDGTGGITDMLTPQFDQTQFAEAGALPNLNLDLSNVITQNGATDLSFDPAQYLQDSRNLDPQVKQDVTDEVSAVLQNADAGDEEDGIRAVAAVALDSSDISPEEVKEGYTSISDLINEGGLPAVEQFVRDVYTDGNNTESIPEWALPASVFGTFLMNEPGDWRQAILRARGKTAATMLNKRTADAASKKQLELDIKKKALDLFASGAPTATSLVGLVGKVTPESLAKYEKSNKLSDLQLITSQKDVGDLLKDFTAPSVAAFQKSGDYNDLVRLPGKGEKGTTTLDFLKEFTPSSVKEYEDGGREDASVLVRKPNAKAGSSMTIDKMFELLETYTPESVDDFKASNNFSDLVLKDSSSWEPTVGSATEAQQQGDLKIMETVSFRENLRNAKDEDKIKRLRDYALLHAQTTQKINEKTLAGDVLKQRIPLASFSVEAYAEDIGLSLDNPEVGRILNVAKTQLPYAKPEDINRLGALNSLKDKVNIMGAILDATPENVAGVMGYVFDTNAARMVSDVIPGFEIPSGATVSQVFASVAEVNLIKDILNEARFSDKDRELVRDFIRGRKFKTPLEAKLRHKEVMEIIDRALTGLNFQLENYQLPPGSSASDTDPENTDNRLNQLRQNILDLSNKGG
jgi:hypothetical protein